MKIIKIHTKQTARKVKRDVTNNCRLIFINDKTAQRIWSHRIHTWMKLRIAGQAFLFLWRQTTNPTGYSRPEMSLLRERCTIIPAVFFIFAMAISPVSLQTVTLFKDKNFKHHHCDVQVQGCKPVCDELKSQASSLRGNVDCAHFYRREGCANYMGTWNLSMGPLKNFKHTDAQDSIVSVGDCKQPIGQENSVTFYEHKDYRGRSCTIQVKGCQPMCQELVKRASSAEGNAACLRAYRDTNCQDYAGDLHNLKQGGFWNFKETSLQNYQDSISSISDCSNSTITFYELYYRHGKNCTIRLNGCQPMCPELHNTVKSVSGLVTCVHMYKGPNCTDFIGTVNSAYFRFHKTTYTVASVEDCGVRDSDKSLTRPLNLRRPLNDHP
nr:PREDICTED: uncharacterized protein LOC109030944 isoform X3 [Bemisia tabaci]